MHEYLEQGAHLCWLIDVENKSVEIYRPGTSVETRTAIARVAGEGPLPSPDFSRIQWQEAAVSGINIFTTTCFGQKESGFCYDRVYPIGI